jgi:hypothetical protein
MARMATYTPGSYLRCSGCGYEGTPLQMGGHRHHTLDPYCQRDPIILKGGLTKASAERLPLKAPPPAPRPTPAKPAPAPQVVSPPKPPPPPPEVVEEEPSPTTSPSNPTPMLPPHPEMSVVSKDETLKIPVPPSGKVTVKLNPQSYLYYNGAQTHMQLEGTFDEFVEECIEFTMNQLGYAIGMVPLEWLRAS